MTKTNENPDPPPPLLGNQGSQPLAAPAAPGYARAYAQAKFRLGLASGLFDIALLLAFLLSGLSLRLATALPGRAWVVVCFYVLIAGAGFELLSLPFAWLGRRIEIRFGMNRQSAGSWWLDQAKGLALSAGLGLAAVELIYWLLRAQPHFWWLWAWAAFALFTVLMAQLGPVLLLPLFFKMRQMSEDEPLRQRLEATYAALRRQNPKLPRLNGIFEWKLGEKTAKANAALTGLGRTRRVIISDTLLESSPLDEIEAVFVHELGHHVHHDIWRGMAFNTVLSLLGFWLAHLALLAFTKPLGGVANVAGLPLLILVFTLLGFALLPVSNGFVRAMERAADDYSFSTLGTAQPLIAGLERLAAKNLAEVSPPRWKEWLLYSHPSIATRIRRGHAWQEAASKRVVS